MKKRVVKAWMCKKSFNNWNEISGTIIWSSKENIEDISKFTEVTITLTQKRKGKA